MQNVLMFGAVSRPALVPQRGLRLLWWPCRVTVLGSHLGCTCGQWDTWARDPVSGPSGSGMGADMGTCFTHPHPVQSQSSPSLPTSGRLNGPRAALSAK